MTIIFAALLGMGLIALWGLIALMIAIKSAKINHHIDTGAIHSNNTRLDDAFCQRVQRIFC